MRFLGHVSSAERLPGSVMDVVENASQVRVDVGGPIGLRAMGQECLKRPPCLGLPHGRDRKAERSPTKAL
eukprot:7468815-Lingulodinium_polyedra.AAC.1